MHTTHTHVCVCSHTWVCSIIAAPDDSAYMMTTAPGLPPLRLCVGALRSIYVFLLVQRPDLFMPPPPSTPHPALQVGCANLDAVHDIPGDIAEVCAANLEADREGAGYMWGMRQGRSSMAGSWGRSPSSLVSYHPTCCPPPPHACSHAYSALRPAVLFHVELPSCLPSPRVYIPILSYPRVCPHTYLPHVYIPVVLSLLPVPVSRSWLAVKRVTCGVAESCYMW